MKREHRWIWDRRGLHSWADSEAHWVLGEREGTRARTKTFFDLCKQMSSCFSHQAVKLVEVVFCFVLERGQVIQEDPFGLRHFEPSSG